VSVVNKEVVGKKNSLEILCIETLKTNFYLNDDNKDIIKGAIDNKILDFELMLQNLEEYIYLGDAELTNYISCKLKAIGLQLGLNQVVSLIEDLVTLMFRRSPFAVMKEVLLNIKAALNDSCGKVEDFFSQIFSTQFDRIVESA